MMQTDKCFITGLDVTNIPGEIDIYEYKLSLGGKTFTLRFDVRSWDQIIIGEIKTVLTAFLLNDKWPLDPETIISQQLIDNIARMGPQPKTFREKCSYFLRYLYDKGADELKWVPIDIAKFHITYAKNDDEFARIIDLVSGEKLIEHARPFVPAKNIEQSIRLTPDGIRSVEGNQSTHDKLPLLIREIPQKPSIFLLFVEKDKQTADRFNKLFMDAGFTVHSNGNGAPERSHAFANNVRQTIYSEVNYVLIIKSRISDINNTFGSVVDIAIESHILNKSTKNFIYIATIDDSPFDSRPRLVDYHLVSYEGRLHNIRKRLLFDILTDWRNRIVHLEENKIVVETKLDLLRWMLRQLQIYQQNPVKFDIQTLRKSSEGKGITNSQELANYLEDLKSDNVITYQVYKTPGMQDHFDFHVTILQIAPDWLSKQLNAKSISQKTDIYDENEEANTVLPNIVQIHDELFLFLKEWSENARTASPGPVNPNFYMRSVRDARFKKGFWFPGSESYLCLSFWAGGDSHNKTPNIYFEIHAKHGIRVLLTSKDSENKAEYLKSLVNHLNSNIVERPYIQYKSTSMWIRTISESYKEYFKHFSDFIESDKVIIDNYFVSYPPADLEEFGTNLDFISTKSFDTMISRVLVEREIVHPKKENDFAKSNLDIGITSINIENYQGIIETSIEELPIDSRWIFLTGENGFGKTSLLQALALGTSPDHELDKFLEEKSRIQVGIEYKSAKDYAVRTKDGLQSKINYGEYCVGYGPARLNINASNAQDEVDKSENSVLSLFDNKALLKNINYELFASNKSEPELFAKLEELIRSVTGNRISEIKVQNREVTYIEKLKNGDEMKPLPLEKLATGYKVIINMVFDIFIRFQKTHQSTDSKTFFGVVYIDEIENHLHPIFQKEIPSLLSTVFPKIQFIATTHSPIPLLGAPKNSIILKVDRNLVEGIKIERLDEIIEFPKMTPNAILSSPIFGFEEIFSVNYEASHERIFTEDLYSEIVNNKERKDKLKEIAKKLRK